MFSCISFDTTITNERILLLFCILEGLNINVGNIMSKEIVAAVKKPNGNLFFPNLITRPCIKQGVEVEPHEDVLLDKGEMDIILVSRLKANEPTKR